MVWDGLGWSDGKGGTLGALNTALTLSPLCFQLALEGRAENMRMKKIFENVSLNRRQIKKMVKKYCLMATEICFVLTCPA